MPDGWLYALLGFVLFVVLMLALIVLLMHRTQKRIAKMHQLDIEELKKQPP